jgi:hypothetical protein
VGGGLVAQGLSKSRVVGGSSRGFGGRGVPWLARVGGRAVCVPMCTKEVGLECGWREVVRAEKRNVRRFGVGNRSVMNGGSMMAAHE